MGITESDDLSFIIVISEYCRAIRAINVLFTIAEAWNKADGFIPDFGNHDQRKYFLRFQYDDHAAAFVYSNSDYTASSAYAYLGFASRLKNVQSNSENDSLTCGTTSCYFVNNTIIQKVWKRLIVK